MKRINGFTITELMIALPILLVVLGAATELFRSTFQLSYQSADMNNRAASVDSAMGVLRRDVWSASKIEIADSAHIALAPGVRWTITPDGQLRRDDGHVQSWACGAAKWRFGGDGNSLVVTDPDSPQPMVLCSQILIAGGRP